MLALVLVFLVAPGCGGGGGGGGQQSTPAPDQLTLARSHVQHVVVIMQENRSFDSYFGTYPGAEGIPAGVCVPDAQAGGCVAPYHNPSPIDTDAVHSAESSTADVDGGRMDGFVNQGYVNNDLSSATNPHGVMAYHDAREIPNYWAYAQKFRFAGPYV